MGEALARGATAADRLLDGWRGALLLALLFAGIATLVADRQGFNYDEGVVIAQTALIRAGELPFVENVYALWRQINSLSKSRC